MTPLIEAYEKASDELLKELWRVANGEGNHAAVHRTVDRVQVMVSEIKAAFGFKG